MSKTIGVQLTTRCNLRCVHCFVDATPTDLPPALLIRIAEQAREVGCTCLDFTGGEPTSHPQLPEMLRALRVHDLLCTFVTNGWDFPRVFPLLVSHRGHIRHLSLSLESATAGFHDRCRGQGSFDRLMKAAELCLRADMSFGFRMTVSRANIDQLPAMLALADERGACELALIPLMPTPRTYRNGWMLWPEDMQRLLKQSVSLRDKGKRPVVLTAGCFTADPLNPCPAFAGRSVFVTARGDVSCCCQLADHVSGGRTDLVGTLTHMSLREAVERVRDTLQRVVREKSRQLDGGELGYLDHHPCWYCLKRFGKVDWMRSLPDHNPWSQDLKTHEVARAVRRAQAQDSSRQS